MMMHLTILCRKAGYQVVRLVRMRFPRQKSGKLEPGAKRNELTRDDALKKRFFYVSRAISRVDPSEFLKKSREGEAPDSKFGSDLERRGVTNPSEMLNIFIVDRCLILEIGPSHRSGG